MTIVAPGICEMANLPAVSQADEHNVLDRSHECTSSKWSMVAWLGLGTIAVALIAWTAGLVWRSQRQLIEEQHLHAVEIRFQRVLSDLKDSEVI